MFRFKGVVFAMLAAALPAAAEACTLRLPAGAEATIVPTGRIDSGLLDAAVRAEVNLARCRAGLGPLRPANVALARIAEGHSRWMQSSQTLSHRSAVAGKGTLRDRIQAAGIRPRAGAENIGYVSRYRIDGAPFRILDARACQFSTYSGQPLPPHTYATLARQIVDAWMASASHRANILSRNVDRVSTGAAFDPNGPYCGRFWFTQAFVG